MVSIFERRKGNVTGALSTAQDITDQRKSEEALRKSEEQWRSLVMTMPDFVALLGTNGEYLFLNHFAKGYSEKDIVGKKAIDFILPESRHIFETHFRECIKGKLIQQFEYLAFGEASSQRLYESFLIPIIENGHLINILSLARDITERKKAEDALHESEERFEAFMNHLPLTAFIKDSNFNNLFINRYMADLMGAKEWVGKSTNDLFSPEVAKVMIADDKLALQEGYRETIEILPTSHKGVKIFETYKFRIDRGDKPPLIGGFSIDATERKKAEEELLRQTEELEARNEELERFNKVAVGREMRMIELKKKINELSKKLGQKPPYSATSEGESRLEKE